MSVTGISQSAAISALDLVNQKTTNGRVKSNASTTGSSSASSGSGITGTTTGTTFLNLLVKELQNQDPTAPMDSTAMVGQMISLNQLDQLISINQTLTGATGSSTTSKAKAATTDQSVTASATALAARNSLIDNTFKPTSAAAATLAANNPSTTLDFSSLNIFSGGK